MSMSVCLSVHSHNTKTTLPNFTIFLCMLPFNPDSVLLSQRYNTLCNSGFVDDVMISQYGPMARHMAIAFDRGISKDFNTIWLNDKDQQVGLLIVIYVPEGRSLLSTMVQFCVVFKLQ